MHHHEFRAWRERMGYTQQQAAEVLDLSVATIGNYEGGARREDGRPVTIPILVEVACQAAEAKSERMSRRRNTKRVLLRLIEERLATNGANKISAADMRAVLTEIVEAAFAEAA